MYTPAYFKGTALHGGSVKLNLNAITYLHQEADGTWIANLGTTDVRLTEDSGRELDGLLGAHTVEQYIFVEAAAKESN